MSEHKAWVKDAKKALSAAEDSLDNFPWNAYQQALKSAEHLLKAVLVRAGKFVPGTRHDYTHKLRKLLDKIESEKCIPPKVIDKVREIVPELDRIDVGGPKSSPSHVDCSTYTSDVEYSNRGTSATDRISKEKAEEKIRLSRQLLELLLPYLDC